MEGATFVPERIGGELLDPISFDGSPLGMKFHDYFSCDMAGGAQEVLNERSRRGSKRVCHQLFCDDCEYVVAYAICKTFVSGRTFVSLLPI